MIKDIKDEDTAEIKIENLSRVFELSDGKVEALKDINLDIRSGDFVVIFGPSGCGKSTLLNLILGLDKPTSGRISIKGVDIAKLSEDKKASFRVRKIGTVYQMPYWVKSLTLLENVALPLIIEGIKPKVAINHAGEILRKLKIFSFANHRPTQLSGGQQQKAEFARALVTNPAIVIADEPTGNLDSASAKEVINLLVEVNRTQKSTIILVTHNEEYWSVGSRRIEMKDGTIVKDNNHG